MTSTFTSRFEMIRLNLDEKSYIHNLDLLMDYYDYMQRPPNFKEIRKLDFIFDGIVTLKNKKYRTFLIDNHYIDKDTELNDIAKIKSYVVINKKTEEIAFVGTGNTVSEWLNISKNKVYALAHHPEDTEPLQDYEIKCRTFEDYLNYKKRKEEQT